MTSFTEKHVGCHAALMAVIMSIACGKELQYGCVGNMIIEFIIQMAITFSVGMVNYTTH